MFDYIILALVVILKLLIYEQLKANPSKYWLNALKYLSFNFVIFTALRIIVRVLFLPLLMLTASLDFSPDVFVLIIVVSIVLAFIMCDLIYYRKTVWVRNYNRNVLLMLVNLVVVGFVSAISYYGLYYSN